MNKQKSKSKGFVIICIDCNLAEFWVIQLIHLYDIASGRNYRYLSNMLAIGVIFHYLNRKITHLAFIIQLFSLCMNPRI